MKCTGKTGLVFLSVLSFVDFRLVLYKEGQSENHCDEFSATSGKDSIRPLQYRLTSRYFPKVIPATEKKKNVKSNEAGLYAPVKEIPEVNQREKIGYQ